MKTIKEIKALIKMSEGFGLTPDPKLLSELTYLEDKQRKAEKLQADIAGRVGQAVINFKDPKNKQANPISNMEPMSGMTGSVTAQEEYERKNHYPDGKPIPAALPPLYQIETNKDVPSGQNCKNCGYMENNGQCSKWHAAVRPNYWCAKWIKMEKKSMSEEVLYAANKVQSTPDQIANYITRNPIKETVISQGDPVLAQQGGSLAAQVKRLEQWVSKLGAAGPGSGAAWLWDLGDVDIGSKTGIGLSSGQTLIYDAGRKKWNNAYLTSGQVTTALGFTPVSAAVQVFSSNVITVSTTTAYNLSTTASYNILNVTVDGLTATLNMPSSPTNGQITIFAVINNTVTLAQGTGTVNQSFAGGHALGTSFTYIYLSADNTWYRVA